VTKFILIVAFSAIVNFPDGSTVTEHSTVESRHFDSESACEHAGKRWELMKRIANSRQATRLGATVAEEKYSFHCVDSAELM